MISLCLFKMLDWDVCFANKAHEKQPTCCLHQWWHQRWHIKKNLRWKLVHGENELLSIRYTSSEQLCMSGCGPPFFVALAQFLKQMMTSSGRACILHIKRERTVCIWTFCCLILFAVFEADVSSRTKIQTVSINKHFMQWSLKYRYEKPVTKICI